jgi:4-diphosphocytidyl-2-C-methyl-D-erythritol kinase
MPTQQRAPLIIEAPAKINLGLRVTGRRGDGYHTIETLMQKIDLCDELVLCPGTEGIRLRCPGGETPENSDNLVYRAADLFLQTMAERLAAPVSGVDIVLRKHIPVAAGLGGGSSDAAAVLKGMQALFAVECTNAELVAMGLRLGTDIPFFLADTPAAMATGIGEVLTPVAPLHKYFIVLVNPGFPVSTQWVYQTFALTEFENESIEKGLKKKAAIPDVESWPLGGLFQPAAMQNDLETVTVTRYPVIERLKDELVAHGAEAALMSGSGPTVFGLFAHARDAEFSCSLFRKRFKYTYLAAPLTRSEHIKCP